MLYKNKVPYMCKILSLENLKLFLISDYNTCSTLYLRNTDFSQAYRQTIEDNGKDTQKGFF